MKTKIYQSGTKDIFAGSAVDDSLSLKSLTPVYRHSLIGIDLADILLFSKIGVSYAYLHGKMAVGFFGINVNIRWSKRLVRKINMHKEKNGISVTPNKHSL